MTKPKISLATLLLLTVVIAVSVSWYVDRRRPPKRPELFANLSIGQVVRVYKEPNGYRIGVIEGGRKSTSGRGEIIEIGPNFLRVTETYRRRGKITEITRTIPIAAITVIETTRTRADPKVAPVTQSGKGGDMAEMMNSAIKRK